MVFQCNTIIRETNTPLCPCGLTLIGYQIWECVNNCKRPRRFEQATESFNSQLLARNLYWYVTSFSVLFMNYNRNDCSTYRRLGQGYIALKTLDESKFRIPGTQLPGPETLPANAANLSKVIPAQPLGMEMDR